AQSLSELPGPGQYEPRHLANQSEGARAAFRSTSLRLENPSDEAAPGPGDYHDGLVRLRGLALRSPAPHGLRPSGRPVGYIPEHLQSLDMRMPTFKERPLRCPESCSAGGFLISRTLRQERSAPHITRVHRDLPAASAKARGHAGARCGAGIHREAAAPGVLGNFANEVLAGGSGSASIRVSRQCLGSQALAVALPGPGEYQEPAGKKGSKSKATAGSAFQGSKRMDLGAQESSFPGPGKYEPRKVASPMARTLRSAFQSTSDRGKIEALTFSQPSDLAALPRRTCPSDENRVNQFMTVYVHYYKLLERNYFLQQWKDSGIRH
ncbi:stpg1, partial [Symbiodinium necroappetens]